MPRKRGTGSPEFRLVADPPDGDYRGKVRELSAGDFALTLVCPRCSESVVLGLHIGPRLTAEGQVGAISAKCKAKAVEHICGQRMLPTPVPDALPFPEEEEAEEAEAFPSGFPEPPDDTPSGTFSDE